MSDPPEERIQTKGHMSKHRMYPAQLIKYNFI